MMGKELNKTALMNARWHYLICLLLVIATLVVYWQVGAFDFVDYDDQLYVFENRHVREGLNWKSVAWAFQSTDVSNWHPLTWLSHLVDVQLYGLNPGSHHLTSLIIHIINSILLFLIFRRMTGAIWQSAFVAALFALHPLHVESVAWIAERKDVLSAFFWLLALQAYVGYVERPGVWRYGAVFLYFGLGLMAKPMLVTLPFVLLLLDYWPLGRLSVKSGGDGAGLIHRRKVFFDRLREKIPFFLLTLASCTVTLIIQYKGGAVSSLKAHTLHVRVANALVAYTRYIAKMIWPAKLAVFYPLPGLWPWWQVAGASVLLVILSVWMLKASRRQPVFIVGWLWYLGTLVPVIGLVQVGAQAMADRYTYIPLVGLFIIIAWGTNDLFNSWRYKEVFLTLTALLALSGLMAGTWMQVGYWQNSETLFSHAVKVTPNNFIAYNGLGGIAQKKGSFEKAIFYYSKIFKIYPFFAEAYFNMGNVLNSQGKNAEAANYYREALRINPRYSHAHYNLGNILQDEQRLEQSIKHYRQALRIDPDFAEAHNNLGIALAMQGRKAEAIRHFRAAIRIKPDYAGAHKNLKKMEQ